MPADGGSIKHKYNAINVGVGVSIGVGVTASSSANGVIGNNV